MEQSATEAAATAEAAALKPLPRAPFPAPPPFWRHFTTANLTHFSSLPPDSSSPLPYNLLPLRPPPPPTPAPHQTYTAFDTPHPTVPVPTPTSPSTDPDLLFNPSAPDFQPAVLLSRLTKSLLLNFLELSTILAENVQEREGKVRDIKVLMYNVHAVINVYRPHQARESVREMLEGVLEQGRREMEESERAKGEVQGFLRDVEGWKREGGEERRGQGVGNGTDVNGMVGGKKEDGKVKEARRLWSLVHEIAGE